MKVPYHELPGLDQVYLEDSFVTGLVESEAELSFLLDLVLREGHPRYSPPRPNEQYCFRRARLTFANPRRVLWERKEFRTGIDAGDEIDYGNIDWMEAISDDSYRLEGSWGSVIVTADPPLISFMEGQ